MLLLEVSYDSFTRYIGAPCKAGFDDISVISKAAACESLSEVVMLRGRNVYFKHFKGK